MQKNKLEAFQIYLIEEEKSLLTIEKYMRDVKAFLCWLGNSELNKKAVLSYKNELTEKYAINSINSMLSSVNSYLVFVGRSDCRVKTLRLQRSVYCAEEKELTREEYKKLLQAAKNDKVLALLMQTIAVTGIRVSEHRFITVEAARNGKAEVRCKGKGYCPLGGYIGAIQYEYHSNLYNRERPGAPQTDRKNAAVVYHIIQIM